ncbi:hypothetical protein [Paenibacillus phytorum]|uniref:hypothetical protein n=1 Tax=Paenibacillus phytorum TaxID=2654977 RepID=UPI001FE30A67|nr:hypothetical protein [Paenibacillus phytorum]
MQTKLAAEAIPLLDARRLEPSDQQKMKEVGGEVPEWVVEAYPHFAYGLKGIHWDMVDGKPKNKTPDLTKEVKDKYLCFLDSRPERFYG